MKQNIQIKQWLELKPYAKYKKTDSYYLKLSNKVHHRLIKNSHTLVLRNYLAKSEIEMLACFLSSYFEDIISKTNIWNSFVNSHQRLYKKFLPFYPTELYNQNGINLQDICFLMWHFINSAQEEILTAPTNEFIIKISSAVYEIFIESENYAPVNKDIQSYYHLDANETDYYVTRKLIDTILFRTYLFYPDTVLDFKQQIAKIQIEHQSDPDLMAYLNDFQENSLHKTCTQLMALNGKQWLAEIIGNKHPLYQDILSISPIIKGMFLYKGQDQENIHIEHIASGKRFEMTKLSFDEFDALETIDNILYLGIVQWKDQWWFSGMFFQQPYDENIFTKEKQSLQSKIDVSFLDQTKTILALHHRAFKEFNNKQSIVFLPSEKINDFYEKYIQYYNSTLNLTAKQRKINLPKLDIGTMSFEDISETGLVFFNPKGGIEIVLNNNNAFPLPNNPYFDPKHSTDDIMHIMTDKSISTELVMYCMDTCKSKLPFFDTVTGQYIFNDLDFLLRYWKKDKYYRESSLSVTSYE